MDSWDSGKGRKGRLGLMVAIGSLDLSVIVKPEKNNIEPTEKLYLPNYFTMCLYIIDVQRVVFFYALQKHYLTKVMHTIICT